MTDQPGQLRQRDEVLAGLLADPHAVLVAIASDGVLVPMPAAVGLPPQRALTAPADRATTLDLVVPEDGMKVVAAWDQARNLGVGFGTVRPRYEPGRPLKLTFVDMNHSVGSFIGAFSAAEDAGIPAQSAALPGSLVISRRPRTATVHKNVFAVLTAIDERTTGMLGWTAEQMVGARTLDFLHPDDHERAIAAWMELISEQDTQRIRLRHRCADGSWLWLELENAYQFADNTVDAVVVTQLSDISDEMAAHEESGRWERMLRRLAEALPTGLLQVTSDREVVYANPRLPTMLGVAPTENLDELLAPVVESDRAALDAALDESFAGDFDAELEVRVRLPLTGETRSYAVSLVSLSDREGVPGALICLNDVTDSARMREELKVKATFDDLTGCHNRASIAASLDLALHSTDGLLTAVVFVDLDKFKPVNDTHGHDAGDELLVHAATRLKSVLRHDDVVGRIGGDEFLLVSSGLASEAAAMALAERVREALHQPATLSAGTVEMCASIGVACSSPGLDGTALTRRADRAMYESKQQSQGRPVLYSSLLG